MTQRALAETKNQVGTKRRHGRMTLAEATDWMAHAVAASTVLSKLLACNLPLNSQAL